MNHRIVAAGLALAALLGTTGVQAAAPPTDAVIAFVPTSTSPTPPAGLKIACMSGPNSLTPINSCPVIQYQGVTTWAYSYIDNRVSFALVGYDSTGKIVRNVEKPGARYVWNMVSSGNSQLINISGQSNQYVEVNWSEVGH